MEGSAAKVSPPMGPQQRSPVHGAALPPSRGVESWRARFVLSAQVQATPKVALLGGGPHSAAVERMSAEASAALSSGEAPELVDDGLGGTYFISRKLPGGREEKICVFKPRDEEPNAINNPKREQQEATIAVGAPGLKGGIRVGDAALNECAAYLLDSTDRAAHFSRVPPTAIVHVEHSAFFDAEADGATHACGLRSRKTKVGSLQQFVKHDGFAEDYSQSLFSDLDVQRIAVLDVRTFNTDRHAANLLVQKPASKQPASDGEGRRDGGEDFVDGDGKDAYRLVPIDHGFCLPAAITVPCFEWAHWPQAKAPMTPEVLAYISSIDLDADAALLTNGSLPPSNAASCNNSCVSSLLPSPVKPPPAAGVASRWTVGSRSLDETAIAAAAEDLDEAFGAGRGRSLSPPAEREACEGGSSVMGVNGKGTRDGSGIHSSNSSNSNSFKSDSSNGWNFNGQMGAHGNGDVNESGESWTHRHGGSPSMLRGRSTSTPTSPLMRGLCGPGGGAGGLLSRVPSADQRPRDASPLGQIRAGCVTTLRVGTLMLTQAAEHGLTLSQLADFMCEPAGREQAAQLCGAASATVRPRPLQRADSLPPTLPSSFATDGAGSPRPGVRRSLLPPLRTARGVGFEEVADNATPAVGGAGASRVGLDGGLWNADDMAAAAAAAAAAARREGDAQSVAPPAGPSADSLEEEAGRLQRIALMRRDRSYLAIPPVEAEEVEAEALRAQAEAQEAEVASPPLSTLQGGGGLAARRGHGLEVEVDHEDGEEDGDPTSSSNVITRATPLSQAATAEKRCAPDNGRIGGKLEAEQHFGTSGAGTRPAVEGALSATAIAVKPTNALTGCSPVSIFAGCGSQLEHVSPLPGMPGSAASATADAPPAGNGGDGKGPGADVRAAVISAPLGIAQSCSSSTASSLSNSCTASMHYPTEPPAPFGTVARMPLDLSSPSSPGSDSSGGPPPAIMLQGSPPSSPSSPSSPHTSLRPSPQTSPERSVESDDTPEAIELGPSVHGAQTAPDVPSAQPGAAMAAATPRSLPPIAPSSRNLRMDPASLAIAAGCGKLALDTVTEDGPTALQILCEAARAEALRRTYPTLRNAHPLARRGDAGGPFSPQRRDRISERAFIELLSRRVSAHFAKIGNAEVGQRNVRAIRAASAARASACAGGEPFQGGATCAAAVAAARAVLHETSEKAVDIADHA